MKEKFRIIVQFIYIIGIIVFGTILIKDVFNKTSNHNIPLNPNPPLCVNSYISDSVPKSILPKYNNYSVIDISSDKMFQTVIWKDETLFIVTKKRLKCDTIKNTYFMYNYCRESDKIGNLTENIHFTFIER